MDFCQFSVISLFVFIQLATGLDDSGFAKILKFEYNRNSPNSYFYEYETSDGQSKQETGTNADSYDFTVTGSYSYQGSDGITYEVHYTADKDGFHPMGDHIKVPPYIPWPVNRIIQEYPEEGQYRPRSNYLPSSEKPPTSPNHQFDNSVVVNRQEVPSSTPQPPLRAVTNAYIPSSPSVVVQKKNVELNINEGNPFRTAFSSNRVSNAYIPSTPIPSVNSVTVSPLNRNQIGAASTQIPSKSRGGRQGRGRNFEAYKRAQSDLIEVIQNNHSSHGVFKNDK